MERLARLLPLAWPRRPEFHQWLGRAAALVEASGDGGGTVYLELHINQLAKPVETYCARQWTAGPGNTAPPERGHTSLVRADVDLAGMKVSDYEAMWLGAEPL